MAFTATSAFAQLANSPWPELYYDSKLSKTTNTQGPSTNVAEKWRRSLGTVCVGNASIGSDSNLYLINNQTLYKIDYATGATIPPTVSLFPASSIQQPLVATEIVGGQTVDRIYAAKKGKFIKFTPTLSDPPVWEVTLRYNFNDVWPMGYVLSPTNNTSIIFVAINDALNNQVVLYTVHKGTGATATFDVKDWAQTHLGLDEVTVDNTVSIGPNPEHSGFELCYVLLRQGYLLAVEFNPSSKVFTGVDWSRAYSPIASSTSPVVSEDGNRVYFATGIGTGHSSKLLALRTTDGAIMAESFEIGAKARASPVIDNDTARGGNVIYIHSTLGTAYAFLDQGTSFRCVWRTPLNWEMTGGGGAKSSGFTGLFYIPFIMGPLGSSARGGGFDTSPTSPLCADPNPDTNCDCTASQAVWSLALDASGSGTEKDECVRSFGFNPTTGKSQVYFGTQYYFYSFE
jgi:hypothetical protein